MFSMPPDGPDAQPEVVASIVSYLVKPEAYFITGKMCQFEVLVHVPTHLIHRTNNFRRWWMEI